MKTPVDSDTAVLNKSYTFTENLGYKCFFNWISLCVPKRAQKIPITTVKQRILISCSKIQGIPAWRSNENLAQLWAVNSSISNFMAGRFKWKEANKNDWIFSSQLQLVTMQTLNELWRWDIIWRLQLAQLMQVILIIINNIFLLPLPSICQVFLLAIKWHAV